MDEKQFQELKDEIRMAALTVAASNLAVASAIHFSQNTLEPNRYAMNSFVDIMSFIDKRSCQS